MKKAVVFVIALFICNAHCFEDDYYGLDKKLVHAFLDEVYGTNFRMETFIDMMWPRISDVVLESVALPAVEIYNSYNNDYMCATETTMRAQMGKLLNKKLLSKTKTSSTFEVESELRLDGRPVKFQIAKKSVSTEASHPVPVSYTFKGPNRVKMVIEIVNFVSGQKLVTPKCMMKIKNIMVVELSEPVPTSNIKDESLKDVVKNYWGGLDSQMEVVMTIGLVKTIKEGLEENPDLWFCSSEQFEKVDEGYEGEWTYSDDYFKYCLNQTKHN